MKGSGSSGRPLAFFFNIPTCLQMPISIYHRLSDSIPSVFPWLLLPYMHIVQRIHLGCKWTGVIPNIEPRWTVSKTNNIRFISPQHLSKSECDICTRNRLKRQFAWKGECFIVSRWLGGGHVKKPPGASVLLSAFISEYMDIRVKH